MKLNNPNHENIILFKKQIERITGLKLLGGNKIITSEIYDFSINLGSIVRVYVMREPSKDKEYFIKDWHIFQIDYGQIVRVWGAEDGQKVENELKKNILYLIEKYYQLSISTIEYYYTVSTDFIYREHVDKHLPLTKERLFRCDDKIVLFYARNIDFDGGETLLNIIDIPGNSMYVTYGINVYIDGRDPTYLPIEYKTHPRPDNLKRQISHND